MAPTESTSISRRGHNSTGRLLDVVISATNINDNTSNNAEDSEIEDQNYKSLEYSENHFDLFDNKSDEVSFNFESTATTDASYSDLLLSSTPPDIDLRDDFYKNSDFDVTSDDYIEPVTESKLNDSIVDEKLPTYPMHNKKITMTKSGEYYNNNNNLTKSLSLEKKTKAQSNSDRKYISSNNKQNKNQSTSTFSIKNRNAKIPQIIPQISSASLQEIVNPKARKQVNKYSVSFSENKEFSNLISPDAPCQSSRTGKINYGNLISSRGLDFWFNFARVVYYCKFN